MKKIIALLLLVLCISTFVNAQDIKEKKIFDGLKNQTFSLYDFKYDTKSGSYICSLYDTVKLTTSINSNKGNSETYSSIYSYDVIFDKSGNYYAIAQNTSIEYNSTFFLLKNGKSLKQFNNITFPLVYFDEGIYFMANDGANDFRVKFNVNTNEFEYGNTYDTIYLSASKSYSGEGEPAYVMGLTKEGKDYYIACKNQKQMLVVGNVEMKAYDEIIYRSTYEDSLGNIYYFAREGRSYFLVTGDKEFKKFNYVSAPLEFDKDNMPVYCASNDTAEYPSEQFLVKGNDVISRTFTKGIYEIAFTPSGKIALVGADTLPDGTYTNSLFIDGKEITTNTSVMGVLFNKTDVPYYTTMDKDNNSYLVEGTKVISEKYSYISDIQFSKNNKISFMGTIYGDYDKNIPNKSYYVSGNKKYGPFQEVMNYEGQEKNSVTNDKGDFAFIATKTFPVKGEEYPLTKYYLVSTDWKSNEFDYIQNLSTYKNDFYFLAGKIDSKGTDENILYKNDEKLTEDYDVISDLKVDTSKGVVTFLGQKKNKVFFVEIKL